MTRATVSGAGREPVPELALPLIKPLLRVARSALEADAVTAAVQQDGWERLLVCAWDGSVREAAGSVSLGLVSDGPTRLAGIAGVLQAAECASVFGFTPAGYLGARFRRPRRSLSGGVAAWSRKPRRWPASHGTLLREIATLCARQVETARGTEGLRIAALRDPLTGLANRAPFEDSVERALGRLRRNPRNSFATILIDLNGITGLDAGPGKGADDELRVAVAGRLGTCLRSIDTVAKLDGDEFAVLLDGVVTTASGDRVVQRIRAALAPPFYIDGHEIFLQPNVGLVMGSSMHECPGDVLRDAHAASQSA